MAMKLKAPKPRMGGNFADRMKLNDGKNVIRVFPFGKDSNLAVERFIHFVDGKPVNCGGDKNTCEVCAEYEQDKTNNKIRKNTKYVMAVVNMLEDMSKVVRLEAPTSVYNAIYNAAKEDPDAVLGNEGVDFVITRTPGASPQNMYGVTPKIKGSVVLKISPKDIPDLEAEVARDLKADSFNVGEVEGGAGESVEDTNDDEAPPVVYKSKTGKKAYGSWTGRMKGKAYVIETDGRLVTVESKDIISGIEDTK